MNCTCGHPRTQHKGGTNGCRNCDLGCARYEPDTRADAAEKTRVLEAVATVCEDQAGRARTELGQESTSARLRAVEAERDEAQAQRDANMRASAEAASKLIEQRDGAADHWAEARDRIEELEQLLADAGLKLVQQGNEYSAELVRVRGLLEQASAEQAQVSVSAVAPLRIGPVELYGYDAWQCDVCGGRYRPNHNHPCGELRPVRVSITERAG